MLLSWSELSVKERIGVDVITLLALEIYVRKLVEVLEVSAMLFIFSLEAVLLLYYFLIKLFEVFPVLSDLLSLLLNGQVHVATELTNQGLSLELITLFLEGSFSILKALSLLTIVVNTVHQDRAFEPRVGFGEVVMECKVLSEVPIMAREVFL